MGMKVLTDASIDPGPQFVSALDVLPATTPDGGSSANVPAAAAPTAPSAAEQIVPFWLQRPTCRISSRAP